MKLHQGLNFLFVSTFTGHTLAQTTYTCPATPGAPATQVSEATVNGPSVTVRIPVVNDPDGLCTLVRHNVTGGGNQRAPVARSYANHPWEKSAGLFSAPSSGLSVDCSAGTTCDVTLPALSGAGQEYILESFNRTLPAEATAARFLEQATFGSTREEIDALVASGLDFEEWIAEQIGMPPSSLREFYRKRTNPKWDFTHEVGTVGSGPCDIYSRWRTYAISSKDVVRDRENDFSKYITFEQVAGIPGYIWKVDGQFRTITQDLPRDANNVTLALDSRYAINPMRGHTAIADCVGCSIFLKLLDEGEVIEIANPAVNLAGAEGILPLDIIDLPDFKSADLPTIESSDDYPMFSDWIKNDENAMLNTTAVDDGRCNGLPDFRAPLPWSEDGAHTGTFPSIFAKSVDDVTGNEVVFIYDRHLTLLENTVQNPLLDGGGKLVIDTADLEDGSQVKCHNVERNFYNEEHCKLSYSETACAPYAEPKRVIVLDDTNIGSIRLATGKLLYAVNGLALSSTLDINTNYNAPCAVTDWDQVSRWIRDPSDTTCENVAAIGIETYKIYQILIEGTRDDLGYHINNNDVVDVVRDNRPCDTGDEDKTYLGKVMIADGTCWHHVHPSEMNVFDLTGADLASYSVVGNTASIISMEVFENDIINNHTIVGRFGDHVDIDATPPSPLDDPSVQAAYKTLEYNPGLRPQLMCGSPQEIASDPFFGDHGFDVAVPEKSGWRSMTDFELSGQRHTIWTHLALHANDQLRMKMAWSLSQIISVGLPDERPVDDFEDTEAYLAFYDMFVNNGFGSFRQLMTEFSFSYIMARWLSFEDNRSLQYNINKDGSANYPDENFAREIMQLFSVGLYKLNMDGSKVVENGKAVDTYSIEDIVSYSRAWTGFVKRSIRGGVASGSKGWLSKSMDPLKIDVDKRDWFPKTNLDGGFIGDKVALCADLPSKHFIRAGATYKLLGRSGTPELHEDNHVWAQNPDLLQLDLDSTSPLYAKLCEADASGGCTFPAKVVLDQNLVYNEAAKNGSEYAVDTIRAVRMKVGNLSIWYEYIRVPCVEHAFFRDAKRVIQGNMKNKAEQSPNMCANPKLEAATPLCSDIGWETNESANGVIYCHYNAERVKYESAVEICEANGMEQSYPWILKQYRAGPCAEGIQDREFRMWANAECGLKVKVELELGQIAIVHSPGPDRVGNVNVEKHVDIDSDNFFMVPWEGSGHVALNDCLSISSCYVHGDNYCICDTDATESIVYSSSGEVASIDDITSSLHIGAIDPSAFDAGTYSDLGNCGIQGVTVYSKAGDCSSLELDTIFAFEQNTKPIFLKNSKSTVSIPGSAFQFRNPVHFISLSDPEARDAYYETDEVLDSLFYHPSSPPFLAIRLLQRFGVSNPSPDFIARVATAYKTGSFLEFGSNKYGDLGATVAAILLDKESRSVVLDADQASGHLREPLIKVISLFRSMGLRYEMPLQITTLINMGGKIGQGSFEYPSVFSFFLPEFSPPGVVNQAGLVSPEAMVLQGNNMLFLLEAYFNTVKFGIVDCFKMDSFESWDSGNLFSCPSMEGDTSSTPARLSYWPQSVASVDNIIDELDILLTSGRLQDRNRAMIKSIVYPLMGDIPKAVRATQQLILSTPEYHSTTLPRKQDNARELTGYTTKHKAPYKAVVILMMRGGVDSWNMLVPKGQCVTADAYEEYVEARGEVHAIPQGNLTSISAVGSSQDCAEFGVNVNFRLLADLYNQGQALFMANTGVLAEPVTKHGGWKEGLRPFAHNTMKELFYTADVYGEKPGTGVMGRLLDALNQNGLQTSANNVGHGMTMLSGDQAFNNPVYTVSTKDPSELNKYPTIDNLIDVVKTLNGVGDISNSMMSEHWSSRVSSALFENEQMQEIAAIPEFELTDYPVSVKLSESFKAIAGYMKSRDYRKVNREVFFLSQGGFDMHNENLLHEKFPETNDALEGFIQELKTQGLWNSTVIVMGSDFGRSMNANSNGGTDHAWGGHYFMAGGSLKGGRIIGEYPTPLGPESDFWTKRGRWIPTTPWEAIWNGVAQWMGVHDDEELDGVLPNRKSFGLCDLFTDKDLFVDGACQCIQGINEQYTMCDDITYSPTSFPTTSPSMSPTGSPTSTPTADLPDDGSLVTNILEGSSGATFGCVNDVNVWKATSKTTDKYWCDRTGMQNVTTGIIFTPTHGQLTIPKALRLYTANVCQDCDPQFFVLEGRANATLPWEEIVSNELPGVEEGLGRNDLWLDIHSTYASGDTNFIYAEVHFHTHSESYLEYRLSFQLRSQDSSTFQFAEIEIPGMLLPPEPSVSPTLAPSTSPTASPTHSPSVSPTKSPSVSPSVSPTTSPTADLPDDGIFVSTIFTIGSPVTMFGCSNTGNPLRARDGTTNRYSCNREGMHNVSTGIIVSPEHGKTSIAKALRLYASNTCLGCDPLSYILEGRTETTAPWSAIASGEFPLIADGLDRNIQGQNISSTYESGDNSLNYTVVHFPSNAAAYLEYKLTFPETRTPDKTSLNFAEVELPGVLIPPEPSVSPTASPSSSPTKSPSASPSISPTANPTADLPDDGSLVTNILEGSLTTSLNCANTPKGWRSFDKTTDKYWCDRTGMQNVITGIIFTPTHGQLTIPKALRLYTANGCKNCDPQFFVLEGRANAMLPWEEIASNELPGVGDGLDRNSLGLPISSTYASGDSTHVFSEVHFHTHSSSYLEYKISFVLRGPDSNKFGYAELEIPGMLLPPA